MQFLTDWIEHYGYVILFLSLMLELIALPIPGEFLMGYAGVLVFQGKFSWILSVIISGIGSGQGMTISYWIGYRLGVPFFHKHGHRIHMGPDRLEKMSNWFENYGNRLLLIAYFIPGVRHFTGYFSGITHISFRTFAIYAYIGAFIWTGTFISLGKLFFGAAVGAFPYFVKEIPFDRKRHGHYSFCYHLYFEKIQIKNQGNDDGWSRYRGATNSLSQKT